MSRVFLIRHGEVQWNRESAYIGWTDLPLNEEGLRQSERLGERLEAEQIRAVYSSDLMRAHQTAEIVARRLGLDVSTIPELREVDYGEWEGVLEAEVPRRYPDVYAAWRKDPMGVRIPGGETFAELRDRAFPAFCRIAQEHANENVVIVAHKSTNRVILCCLLGMDVNDYREIGQGNAGINIIERSEDGRFVVERINEGYNSAADRGWQRAD